MNQKNNLKIILITLLVSPVVLAAPLDFSKEMSDLQSFALKLLVIAVIFWREKVRMSREAKLRMDHDRMLAQSFLAKKVAHDIRSPLSALQLIINTLHSDNREQKQIISDVVTRINGIAEDLLNSEDKKMPITSVEDKKQSSSSLPEMIQSLVQEKMALFPEMKFSLHVNADNFNLSGKNVELSRVLSNVLNNAIESGSEGNIVHINAYEVLNSTYIEVVDFGQGISEYVLAKLGREKISTKGDLGNGIGLFAAFETVSAWGGGISIQSKTGLGTKVTIKLCQKVA